MKKYVIYSVLICSISMIISGCTDQQGTQSETTENPPATISKSSTFNPAWIPPAEGKGNFEICLGDEATENGIKKVTVPKNVIFQSWGEMTGSIRDSKAHDPRVMGEPISSPLGVEKTYAVITTNEVTLTDKEPCQITAARSVVHKGFRWSHELISASRHQYFAAEGEKVINGKLTNSLWGSTPKDGTIGDAIQFGLLNGSLLGDASDPVMLEDQ